MFDGGHLESFQQLYLTLTIEQMIKYSSKPTHQRSPPSPYPHPPYPDQTPVSSQSQLFHLFMFLRLNEERHRKNISAPLT